MPVYTEHIVAGKEEILEIVTDIIDVVINGFTQEILILKILHKSRINS